MWIDFRTLDELPEDSFDCYVREWKKHEDGCFEYKDYACHWLGGLRQMRICNDWELFEIQDGMNYSYVRLPEFGFGKR